MKYLISTLREKKRYMAFRTITETELSLNQVKDAIIFSFNELFGLIGLAKAGIEFVDYKNNQGILRINNKHIDSIKASFCFLRKINKHDVILRSEGVSGILNKARSKYILGGR